MKAAPENPIVPSPESFQLEEDLSTLLDQQVARLAGRRRRANWLIAGFFGLIAASASVWYVSSENNQRMVSDLIMDIKSSGNDLKVIASTGEMANQYEAALQKIGTHGGDINVATKSLGVDPSTVAEDGMEAETKEMMGGEGVTVIQRNKMLQNGILGRMAKSHAVGEQNTAANGQVASPAIAATAAKQRAHPPAVAAQRQLTPAPQKTVSSRQVARSVQSPAKEVPVDDNTPLVIP